jgi:hypothetical protein
VIHKRWLPCYPRRAVFVSELCERSVKVVEKIASVDAACLAGSGGLRAERELFVLDVYRRLVQSIGSGAYSSERSCRCAEVGALERGTVCECCEAVPRSGRLFVEQELFFGVFPRSEQLWWKGVTDGVEFPGEQRWLVFGSKLGSESCNMQFSARCDECIG